MARCPGAASSPTATALGGARRHRRARGAARTCPASCAPARVAKPRVSAWRGVWTLTVLLRSSVLLFLRRSCWVAFWTAANLRNAAKQNVPVRSEGCRALWYQPADVDQVTQAVPVLRRARSRATLSPAGSSSWRRCLATYATGRCCWQLRDVAPTPLKTSALAPASATQEFSPSAGATSWRLCDEPDRTAWGVVACLQRPGGLGRFLWSGPAQTWAQAAQSRPHARTHVT